MTSQSRSSGEKFKVADVDDGRQFSSLLSAMKAFEFTEDEIEDLWRVRSTDEFDVPRILKEFFQLLAVECFQCLDRLWFRRHLQGSYSWATLSSNLLKVTR